jgi:CI repressor-like protein
MHSMSLDPPNNARAARLREAIEEGPLKAYEIADRLHASRTSVLNWKKRGAINVDNLKGLSDLTGYRFWWLAFGEGPKTINDFATDEVQVTDSANFAAASPEHSRLVKVLSQATQSGRLNQKMAGSLADLISEMVNNRFVINED